MVVESKNKYVVLWKEFDGENYVHHRDDFGCRDCAGGLALAIIEDIPAFEAVHCVTIILPDGKILDLRS